MSGAWEATKEKVGDAADAVKEGFNKLTGREHDNCNTRNCGMNNCTYVDGKVKGEYKEKDVYGNTIAKEKFNVDSAKGDACHTTVRKGPLGKEETHYERHAQ